MYKPLIFLFIFCAASIFCFAQEKLIVNKGVGKVLSKQEKNKEYLKQIPVTTFCGIDNGVILLDSLKKVNDFFIQPPYTLKSVSVYFGGTGFNQPIVASIFDTGLSAFEDLFKRCKEGTRIAFINIKIVKANKLYDAPDMIFTIKEKL
jgi:hypothetical protein